MPMAAISLRKSYFSDSFATNLRRPNLIWVMFYHPGFGNICSNGFEKYRFTIMVKDDSSGGSVP
jgi:hypothetical protein